MHITDKGHTFCPAADISSGLMPRFAGNSILQFGDTMDSQRLCMFILHSGQILQKKTIQQIKFLHLFYAHQILVTSALMLGFRSL